MAWKIIAWSDLVCCVCKSGLNPSESIKFAKQGKILISQSCYPWKKNIPATAIDSYNLLIKEDYIDSLLYHHICEVCIRDSKLDKILE